MLGINSNEEMKKFVQNHILIKKYSYHQINIFVKLFISQYGKFNTKLRFFENGKDITDICIDELAKCRRIHIKVQNIKKEEFPLYEYFYFTKCLNEEYNNEKLSHMDEYKYPVLRYYFKLSSTKEDNNALDNLNLIMY